MAYQWSKLSGPAHPFHWRHSDTDSLFLGGLSLHISLWHTAYGDHSIAVGQQSLPVHSIKRTARHHTCASNYHLISTWLVIFQPLIRYPPVSSEHYHFLHTAQASQFLGRSATVIMKFVRCLFLFFLLTLLTVNLTTSCKQHFQCGRSGVCLSGTCFRAECNQNIHCIGRGFYFKCYRARCIPSKARMCKRDAECKKGFFGRKCKKFQCVWQENKLSNNIHYIQVIFKNQNYCDCTLTGWFINHIT